VSSSKNLLVEDILLFSSAAETRVLKKNYLVGRVFTKSTFGNVERKPQALKTVSVKMNVMSLLRSCLICLNN
jgi:hypothetical protein